MCHQKGHSRISAHVSSTAVVLHSLWVHSSTLLLPSQLQACRSNCSRFALSAFSVICLVQLQANALHAFVAFRHTFRLHHNASPVRLLDICYAHKVYLPQPCCFPVYSPAKPQQAKHP